MKRLIFSLILLVMCVVAQAQESTRAPLDRRTHLGYTGWERIIPTHAKMQFAGGMGVLSAGCGWDYGKKCRWETDLLMGYLPKRYSDAFHFTFTLKQNYIPWQIRLHDRFSIEPLSGSLYLNYISGEEFWVSEPDRYGGAYYRFATRLRLHLSVGQRITWHLRNSSSTLRHVTLYYELHAHELDIAARFSNKSLALSDIVHFSFGVKLQLFSQNR